MKEMTLVEINKEPGNGFYLTNKGTIHNYLPIYEALFSPLRDKELNIFEVGYYHGGSSKLWEKYFSKAIIKTIDIDNCVPFPESERIILELRDINDIRQEYFSDFFPDIAIDDGSHLLEDQIYFIKTVYPVLKEGGLLIVEDIQNIKNQKVVFESIGIPFDIIDLRKVKGRYDDVLILYHK
uniref:Methyltransferase n=1 Tax=viral metagenome TaxID=1070528 RepID=A0A6M3IMB8_9ZZZZ